MLAHGQPRNDVENSDMVWRRSVTDVVIRALGWGLPWFSAFGSALGSVTFCRHRRRVLSRPPRLRSGCVWLPAS